MNNVVRVIPFETKTTIDKFISTMWDYVKGTFEFEISVDDYVVEDTIRKCMLYTYTKKNKKTTKTCVIRFFDDTVDHQHSLRYCQYEYKYNLVLANDDVTESNSRDVFATFYRQGVDDILKYPTWNIGKELDEIITSNQDVEVRFSNIVESLDASGNAKMSANYCIVFVDKE